MKRSHLYCTVAAMMLATALASCQKSYDVPEEVSSISYSFSLCIPATFNAEDAGAKALEPGTGDKEGWLVSKFSTSERIYVYDKSKGLIAQDEDYNRFYLSPDADGPTANLTGTLNFYKYGSGYQSVEVGDVLILSYKTEQAVFNYEGQTGTFNGLNNFDFSVAEVTVTSISGSAEEGYTITTTPAVFPNAQSMFKFTFTELPGSLLNDGDPFSGIESVTIHSSADKLICYYDSNTLYVDSCDLQISFSDPMYDGVDGYFDPDSRRRANGPGVVYAALRFLPLDDENATDLITFTVTCTDGKTYKGSMTSPKGGFQNGKYYTSTIPLVLEGAIRGRFSINGSGGYVFFSKGNLQAVFASAGSSCTWKFADHQYDYVGAAAANNSINGSGSVSQAGAVDLFGWNGCSDYVENYGIWDNDPSHFHGIIHEDLYDWGHNAIANGGNQADQWRTLTQQEWEYLFANHEYGMATVDGIPGIIMLHSGGYVSLFNDNHADFSDNVITASEWETEYESAGVLFLPAAGARNSGVTGCGVIGSYWSSDSTDEDHAIALSFVNNSVTPSQEALRCIGMSVRLVQDIID